MNTMSKVNKFSERKYHEKPTEQQTAEIDMQILQLLTLLKIK